MKDISAVQAVYDLLSTVEHKEPPVSRIHLISGPAEVISSREQRWWQMRCVKPSGAEFAIRVLSEGIPMAHGHGTGSIARYILKEGDGQPIEYVDSRTGQALLPKFADEIFPEESKFARRQNGFATMGMCLGHVLSLDATGEIEWEEWGEPLVVRLNPDEIIYMYGVSKDTEGRYISEGDYNYVALTPEELEEMVELGLNCLFVGDEHEEWAIRQPVFYTRHIREDARLDYPEMLFRANFRGTVPFIDEPEIHILEDKEDLAKIKRPEEGALLLTKRLEEIWEMPSPGQWRRGLLRERLTAKGFNVGMMTLDDADHPIWLTMLETTFYQLMGGASGAVHEGRYQTPEFERAYKKLTGEDVKITPRELLLIDYAFLRGAARAFGKSWGMAIYGQCDPEIAPEAITLAYDMGARYIWFWTHDHQHHLPHFMKLRLLKHLKEHRAAHPRGNLNELLHSAETAIVLPYGYIYFIEFDQMWQSPNLRVDNSNSAGVPHKAVMATALREGLACARRGEDFDYVVDIGQDLSEYRRTLRIGLDGRVTR